MQMKLTNKANRTSALPRVRVTEREREAVEKAAESMGMGLADFIRYCINEQLNKK